MTAEEKAEIVALRSNGATYAGIAEKLNLSINTVKSFYRRYRENTTAVSAHCKCCGKPLVQPKTAREKKFCSDMCRMKWWNSHRDEVNKKSLCSYRCICCGKSFQAYGSKRRKYCSRACYIRHRFGEDSNE